VVRERIVRAFLIEEQKIVKKVCRQSECIQAVQQARVGRG
jgi:hypothetical protein